MGAIRKLAGPVAGLDLADKASSVVNMVKVLTALEEVSRLLQVGGARTGLTAEEMQGWCDPNDRSVARLVLKRNYSLRAWR